MPEKYKHGQTLMVELQGLEGQGLSIWLGGMRQSTHSVTSDTAVREDITYMRNCVFQEGKLSDR